MPQTRTVCIGYNNVMPIVRDYPMKTKLSTMTALRSLKYNLITADKTDLVVVA